VSDCLHCDIHEFIESRPQSETTTLPEIAAKVTEVLADLILTAPPADQTMLLAEIIGNLGGFLLEKSGAEVDEPGPRRSRH
jgi:hypothetical protein